MHDNLKRWTAAGLVIIMLLVGFFAGYTHRHVKLVIGQTSIAQATGQQPGQSARQKISHDCFVCQLTSVAVDVPLLFTPMVFNRPQLWSVAVELILPNSVNSYDFLQR